MAHRTTFAGLAAPDPGETTEVLNSDFIYHNPDLTDQFLRIGAIAHRHDGHAALANPGLPVTLSSAATTGSLAGDETYYVSYTLIDQRGGETLAAPTAGVFCPGAVPQPSGSPIAVVDHGAGIMPAGSYAYALTYTDGDGGETTLGPTTWVVVDPGFASSEVDLSGLNTELSPHGTAVHWRLWRSYEGEDWHLVTESTASAFVDAGFDPPDNPARPPTTNTTEGANSITVTIPGSGAVLSMASAAEINVYLSTDPGLISPAFYRTLPIACAGASFVVTSDLTTYGQPPPVSTSLPGAGRIDPDTDILDWHWKRPVGTQMALPSGGQGDVRMTLDSGHLWGVLGASGASGPGGWSDLLTLVSGGGGGAGAFVASAGNASALIGPFLGFAASGGATVELVQQGPSAVILVSASGGAAGPVGPTGPTGPVGPTGPAGAAGAGGGSGANITISASGGASAISPAAYVEFDASGGVGVSVASAGTSSAQVLIGAPPARVRRVGAGGYEVYAGAVHPYAYTPNVDGSLTLAQTGATLDANGTFLTEASPDGQTVYFVIAEADLNNLYAFRRNPDSTLTQIQVLSITGSIGGLQVSSDGQFVYVGATSLTVYRRNADGTLTATGATYSSSPTAALAISPTGQFLFAYDSNGIVTSYARNPLSGDLRRINTLAGLDRPQTGQYVLIVSPDGLNLYASQDGNGIRQIAVSNGGTLSSLGNMTTTNSNISGLVISPDGYDVYAAVWNTKNVAHYTRNSTTGLLAFVANTATGNFVHKLAITPRGQFVYVSTTGSQGVSTLSRQSGGGLTLVQDTTPTDFAAWSGVAVAPSFGAINVTDIEFIGSAGITVTVASGAIPGGSAQVQVSAPPGGLKTLSGGSGTVNDATVTSTLRIMLTAQDNNTTGALRVSARTPGTSFTITSSNAGDSGVVAYQFFGT